MILCKVHMLSCIVVCCFRGFFGVIRLSLSKSFSTKATFLTASRSRKYVCKLCLELVFRVNEEMN